MDIQKLYEAVSRFQFSANPTSTDYSLPATVGDIKKLIEKTAELFEAFIRELED